jgi:broad specificity phosphatase PhoE
VHPFTKQILFVRHGQCAANLGLGCHGNPESPLTDEGRRQAEVLAARLVNIPIDAIISSTDLRARQTAEIIGEHVGKPIETSALFREQRSPSILWGKPFNDAEAERIQAEIQAHRGEPGWHYSDEDNFEERIARAGQCIEYLAARPESKLLVVSHASHIKTIVAHMLYGADITVSEYHAIKMFLDFENTGISDIRWSGKNWFIAHWNDIAHFG